MIIRDTPQYQFRTAAWGAYARGSKDQRIRIFRNLEIFMPPCLVAFGLEQHGLRLLPSWSDEKRPNLHIACRRQSQQNGRTAATPVETVDVGSCPSQAFTASGQALRNMHLDASFCCRQMIGKVFLTQASSIGTASRGPSLGVLAPSSYHNLSHPPVKRRLCVT